MANNEKIRDEELQYDINRKVAKISVLSGQYQENLMNMDILQVKKELICYKQTYISSAWKKFEKQTKEFNTIQYLNQNQQFIIIEYLFTKGLLNK